MTRGSESGAYYHPYFQKGNLRRTLLMQCLQRSSKKKKSRSNPAPLPGQVDLAAILAAGAADPLMLAARANQMQQLELQRSDQIEQARAQLLLQQEQQELAKLEELRRGQQLNLDAAAGQVETALSQYQNLLARSSAGSNVAPPLTQQQRLLAQLDAVSSQRTPPPAVSGRLSLSGHSPMPSSGRNSLTSASAAGASLGTNERKSILEAASALQRSDPGAYAAVLLAAQQKAAQSRASALGPNMNRDESSTQQALLLQAQQQRLHAALQQGASAQQAPGLNEAQAQWMSFPPNKR